MRSRDVLDAIVRTLDAQRHVVISELRLGAETPGEPGGGSRADLFVLDLPTGIRTVYEIKVSRVDLLAELKDPTKRRRALMVANRYVLAIPLGMGIPRGDLPLEAGLLLVDESGRAVEAVPPPWHDNGPPTWALVAELAKLAGDPVGRRGPLRTEVATLTEERARLTREIVVHGRRLTVDQGRRR